MKNDKLYPYYVVYLENFLEKDMISLGSQSLTKISRDAFESFKIRLETDEHFNKKIIELYKLEMRDKKIDNIFNDIN